MRLTAHHIDPVKETEAKLWLLKALVNEYLDIPYERITGANATRLRIVLAEACK